LSQPGEAIAEAFQLSEVPTLEPRYNIAPTQLVPTVLRKSEQSDRRFQLLRWGLIPSWAKDPAIGARLINARQKPQGRNPRSEPLGSDVV